MTARPRWARLLVAHRRGGVQRPPGPGRVYGTAAVPGRAADAQPADVPWPEDIAVPRVRRPLSKSQRQAMAGRVWAWRLLTFGWLLVTVLPAYAGVRWVGAAALCCIAPMVAVLALLVYAAASDLREHAASLPAGGD